MQLSILLPMALLFSLSWGAIAGENVLCVVSSDIDNDIGKIVYEMDEDNRVIKHLYQDSFHDGKLTGRIELDPKALKSGIVLNRKDKYITVRMYSDNFDETGGVLYLDTLYSGVSGERKEYTMEMAMGPNGPELIQNNVNFTKMKFIAKRSRVLGVIGIEKVVFGN